MKIIFDFNKNANIENWLVVNDVVMGGKSAGNFSLNNEGYGLFEGKVSLENNGGFSSVKYQFESLKVNQDSVILIKLKGAKSNYQFRIKDSLNTKHAYIANFKTTGAWQELRFPLKEMVPQYRGDVLDSPNFSGYVIEQISFLIANKTPENFKLLIDKIELL